MNYTIREIKTDEDFKELEREWEARQRATREMIRHELKTQNGRMTEAPMYCVCETPNSNLVPFNPELLIREIFFTNKEAEQYIEECAHEYDNRLFIYVKSGYRNDGWQYARELMLNSGDL